MPDINLLPDELRSAENKVSAATKRTNDPTSFHVPEEQKPKETQAKDIFATTDIKPPVNPPATQNQQVNKQATETNEPKLKTPAQNTAASVKKIKRQSFLGRLFGNKKTKAKIISNNIEGKDSAESPEKNFNVNLIPEGFDLLPTKKLIFSLVNYFIFSLIIISLGFLGTTLIKRNLSLQSEGLNTAIAEAQLNYNQLKEKEVEANLWNQRTQIVQKLINQHIYWTNFFDDLERITLPEVYYSSIEAAADDTVNLKGAATSYLAVARQYLAFQQATDVFTEVTFSGFSGNPLEGSIAFDANLVLTPGIFRPFLPEEDNQIEDGQ